jgi:hypothetical protein
VAAVAVAIQLCVTFQQPFKHSSSWPYRGLVHQ